MIDLISSIFIAGLVFNAMLEVGRKLGKMKAEDEPKAKITNAAIAGILMFLAVLHITNQL